MTKQNAIICNSGGQIISVNPENGVLTYRDKSGGEPISCFDWLNAVYWQGEDYQNALSLSFNSFEAGIAEEMLYFKTSNEYLEITGKWKAFDWGFELYLSLKNSGRGLIHSVNIKLSDLNVPSDWTFAMPHGTGFFIPVSEIGCDQRINLNYPVYCSMQWMELFGDNQGIYLGTCDTLPRTKFFSSGKKNEIPFMEVSFPDLQIAPMENYELPVVHLMVHTGNWRVGSAHYKSWFESKFHKPNVPEWCSEMPMWAWASCKSQYAKEPEMVYDELPGHSRKFAEYSIKTLQLAGYLENGHDTRFPDYEAGPCMGGEGGLSESIAEIHRQGRRLALYTNGRLADPQSSISKVNEWIKWSVTGQSQEQLMDINKRYRYGDKIGFLHSAHWDTGGISFKERYGKVDFAVMCPSSKEWKDFFIEKLENLVQKYNPDGVYIDQICGAWGMVCYSRDHDHEHPCEAWGGYSKILSELRERIRNFRKDIYISTEGVNDILGINIDIFQAHNWDFKIGLPECAKPAPELFITTFPDYLLYLGPVFKDDLKELRRSFVLGRGVDIAIKDIAECNAEFVKELSFFIQTRQKYCPELLSAIPQPLINEDGILCYLFKLTDSRFVVLGAVYDDTELNSDICIPFIPELSGTGLTFQTPEGERACRYDDSGCIPVDRTDKMWLIERI